MSTIQGKRQQLQAERALKAKLVKALAMVTFPKNDTESDCTMLLRRAAALADQQIEVASDIIRIDRALQALDKEEGK